MGGAGDEVATDQQDPCGGDQPERHGIEPREGHVTGPHIEGDQVVAEGAIHHRHDPQEDHHRAVQGEHLVVGLPRQEIGDGGEQLGADRAGQGAADQIEEKAADQILQADHLVIGAEAQVAQPALGLQRGAGVEAEGHDCTAAGDSAGGLGLFFATQAAKLSGSSTTTVERMPP